MRCKYDCGNRRPVSVLISDVLENLVGWCVTVVLKGPCILKRNHMLMSVQAPMVHRFSRFPMFLRKERKVKKQSPWNSMRWKLEWTSWSTTKNTQQCVGSPISWWQIDVTHLLHHGMMLSLAAQYYLLNLEGLEPQSLPQIGWLVGQLQ